MSEKLIALIIVFSLLISACGGDGAKETHKPTPDVQRYFNQEDQVVCYVIEKSTTSGGGMVTGYAAISCVPVVK